MSKQMAEIVALLSIVLEDISKQMTEKKLEEKPIEDPYKDFKEAIAEGKNVQYFMFRRWRNGTPGCRYDWSLPAHCYRIDTLQYIKAAHKAGKTIEYRNNIKDDWTVLHEYVFDGEPWQYRVRPEVDPYAELKEAYAAGEKIEFKTSIGQWCVCAPTWKYPIERYRVADPYREFKEAKAAGKMIELRETATSTNWRAIQYDPHYNLPVECYRVYDPYRELKEAQAAGKQIEILQSNGVWSVLWYKSMFNLPVSSYRVYDEHREAKEAYAAGKQIQFKHTYFHEWLDCNEEPKWNHDTEYRAKPAEDPYKVFRDAHAAGKEIEVLQNNGVWAVMGFKPMFNSPVNYYRIYDEHREEKEAYAAGKTIQFRTKGCENWLDCNQEPEWGEHAEYRVKPEVAVVQYRRALVKLRDEYRCEVCKIDQDAFKRFESSAHFVKWLDNDAGQRATVTL